jgi:hypothetical protein
MQPTYMMPTYSQSGGTTRSISTSSFTLSVKDGPPGEALDELLDDFKAWAQGVLAATDDQRT